MKHFMTGFLCFFIAFAALAKKQEPVHREHSSHVHGSAKVNIAIENKQGEIEFSAPAMDIIGFEYRPQSKKDKTRQSEQLALIESKISEMVIFESRLECKIEKVNIEMDRKGKHADVDARFHFQCASTPLGSKLVFSFQTVFPALHKVDVLVLGDDLQVPGSAEAAGFELLLKK